MTETARTNSVTSRDGTTIAFDRSGQGPSIILVGGALSDRSAAASLAALLAPKFTVYSYDRRGRGGSGDTPPYAVEREVEDLEALVVAAGGSALVFGHSSGAALALAAAAHGTAITKLALYEPPFVVDDSRPPLPDDYVARLDELASSGRRGDAVEYFMTTAVGVRPEMVAAMRAAPMWPAMEELAHTLAYDGIVMGDTMFGKPLPAGWASVAVPTLVMDGGNSPAWQRSSVQMLAERLPHAQRYTIPGADHAAAPEVVVPVLEGFFSQ